MGFSPSELRKLDPGDLVVLSYATSESLPLPFAMGQLQNQFPFVKYIFPEGMLEERLSRLASQGYLAQQTTAEAALYACTDDLTREAVDRAGYGQGFVYEHGPEILGRIPLSGFVELSQVPGDAFAQMFSKDRRHGRADWWRKVVGFADLCAAAASLTQPVSDFVLAFAEEVGFSLTGQSHGVAVRMDEAWRDETAVQFSAHIPHVTPWKSLPAVVFVVRAADLDIGDQDTLTAGAYQAMLEDAAVAQLVIPVGQAGPGAVDILNAAGLVTIWPEDVKQIVMDKKPDQRFRAILRDRLDIRLLSPYQTRNWVSESMFFGRGHEIRLILSHPGGNFAVYGGRRVGKTSLLKVLQRISEEKRQVFFVDCEIIHDQEEFCRKMCSVLGIEPVQLPLIPDAVKGACQGSLMLIDEIDPVLRASSPEGVLGLLRALQEECGIQCIIAGSTVLRQLSKDSGSAMYNFGDPIFLGPLTEKAALELTWKPMVGLGVQYEEGEGTAKQLVNMCGRFPNVIQFMCNAVVKELSEKASRDITRKLLDKVFEGPAFVGWIADQFFGDLSTVQKLVICAGMLSKQMSFRAIVERVQMRCDGVTVTQVQRSLDDLVDRFLLDQVGDVYQYAYEHFPTILRRHVVDPSFMISQLVKELNQKRRGVP